MKNTKNKSTFQKKARSEVQSKKGEDVSLVTLKGKKNLGAPFSFEALQKLSPNDQLLFQRFGMGPEAKPSFELIHDAFEHYAETIPNTIAIEHLGQTITYKELNDKANKLAEILANVGVVTGDHVGLFIKRSIPMVVGILATLKAGAAYVPQHVGVAPRGQLEHVAKTANTKVILTTSAFKSLVPVPGGHICLFIDDLIKEMNQNDTTNFKPKHQIEVDDTSFVIFTSGTTGPPNGVQVTHKNLCNIVLTSPGNLGIKQGTRVGQILNIAFDMAVWEILGCLGNGGTLVIRGKSIQETVEKVDVVIATPTILSNIDIDKCRNISVAAVAGEPCPRTLADAWSDFCTFYNSCGPTETTIVNTMQLHKRSDEVIAIGAPTPNNSVYILDEHQNPCAIGSIGEMWAGGDCVSKGYIGNAKLNSERYLPDLFLGGGRKMFRTRDLGRWTEKGTLEHFGRTDDQVKIKGFRVELDSISAVLEGMPTCKRAVALKYDNENLIAFVSPETIKEEDAKAAIESTLPYYCIPTKIIAMHELPKTSRGKIDKALLLNKIKEEDEKEEPIAESSSIDDYINIKLPQKKSFIKRIWDGPKLMHYNRLFMLMILVNLGFFLHGLVDEKWWFASETVLENISLAILINFSLAILIRQQYVINSLFAIATSVPKSWPLSIRRVLGKVYHFGGIHVGGTISGAIWFTMFTVILTYNWLYDISNVNSGVLWVTYIIISLLIVMIIFALPKNRAKKHNAFEISHRFIGWTVLLLFWIQTLLFIDQNKGTESFGVSLINSINFWLLVTITSSIILPWLRLKKVAIDIVNPSKHVALVKFNYGVTPFAGSSTAISRNPLFEWHSFANVPSPNVDGFRLTISRAGDWTGKFIDDLPSHVWVKGIPTAGVGNIDKLFKRVIWVATGSGIGPCLPHMLSRETPSLLVWATRNPRKTYGDILVDEILSVQPNAIIWDTDAKGKPDMVKLAYKAYTDFDAEAIICISNKRLTWLVVSEMESRGVPAYGAIWDS